ncbi:MAG: Ig-like domain-containing protein [Spirosomataceae bacterium]
MNFKKYAYGAGLLMSVLIQACDTIVQDVPPVSSARESSKVLDSHNYYTLPNEPLAIDVLAQSNLTTAGSFKLESQPTFGDLTFIDSKGILLFIPDPTALDIQDDVTYVVNANTGSGSTSRRDTVRLIVTPDASRIPCNAGAMHDAARTQQNVAVTIPVLANDRFCNVTLDSTSLRIEVQPTNGKAEIIKNKVVYTPKTGFRGTDLMIYRVCTVGDKPTCRLATVRVIVEGTPTDCRTLVIADALLWRRTEALKDTSITIDVLRNDNLCDAYKGIPISISKVPQNGRASITKDNKVLYVPKPTFKGTETFEYRVCDKDGKNCVTGAIVAIVDVPDPNCKPVANKDQALISASLPYPALFGAPSGSVEIVVWLNDKLCTDLKEITIKSPANVGLVKAENLRIFYFPKAGYLGTDKFEYELTDIKGQKSSAEVEISIVK